MNKVNNLNFILGQGGSGRSVPGTDYVSGLLFYNNTRPGAFVDNIKDSGGSFIGGVHQIFSTSDAEALGIKADFSDETQSEGVYTVTGAGAAGDTIALQIQEWDTYSATGITTNIISLGTTAVQLGDGVNDIAANLTIAVNQLTYLHGYTATNVGAPSADVLITARKGTGIYFNSGNPYTYTIVGTATVNALQTVTPGNYSSRAVYHYHIDRYFKKQPGAGLWVGIFNYGTGDFSEIQKMQLHTGGTIVQLGFWDEDNGFALSTLTKLKVQKDALAAIYNYLSVIIYGSSLGMADTSTLATNAYDLGTLSADGISVDIAQDASGTGWDRYNATGFAITSLGAQLGCLSLSSVAEDIGNNIGAYNVDDGSEFDVLAFADGKLYNSVKASSPTLIDALNTNRYNFLVKVPYTSGSWYNDNHCATSYASDYAYQNDNRVIDKLIKNEFKVLIPVLKSVLKLKSDGTMTQTTIAFLTELCGNVIRDMVTNGDLAGEVDSFNSSDYVTINPTQKPNVASKIVIGISVVEQGIARNIDVPIGFKATI